MKTYQLAIGYSILGIAVVAAGVAWYTRNMKIGLASGILFAGGLALLLILGQADGPDALSLKTPCTGLAMTDAELENMTAGELQKAMQDAGFEHICYGDPAHEYTLTDFLDGVRDDIHHVYGPSPSENHTNHLFMTLSTLATTLRHPDYQAHMACPKNKLLKDCQALTTEIELLVNKLPFCSWLGDTSDPTCSLSKNQTCSPDFDLCRTKTTNQRHGLSPGGEDLRCHCVTGPSGDNCTCQPCDKFDSSGGYFECKK